jgi:adenylate kinase family enzyme
MPEDQEAGASWIQRNSAYSSTLIVIRGNSGSGKTTAAHVIRRRYGRGCALVEQDYLRRIVLREHDGAEGAVAPGLIAATAGHLLGAGYHVVLEGILHRERYAGMLARLIAEHPGPSHVYYFDVPFEETVRRNAARGFSVEEVRGWWAAQDMLGVPGERVLTEPGAEEAVSTILHTSGLTSAAVATPCPTRCPRCAEKSTRIGVAGVSSR